VDDRGLRVHLGHPPSGAPGSDEALAWIEHLHAADVSEPSIFGLFRQGWRRDPLWWNGSGTWENSAWTKVEYPADGFTVVLTLEDAIAVPDAPDPHAHHQVRVAVEGEITSPRAYSEALMGLASLVS